METYNELLEIRKTINPAIFLYTMVPNLAEYALTWAAQQMSSVKSDNQEKYNNLAQVILESATGLPAEEAGNLITNYIHKRSIYLQSLQRKVLHDEAIMQSYQKIKEALWFETEHC
jgi:hypothetical protein